MNPTEKPIELLNGKTAQLPDWQFREMIVEKINEIIIFINDNTVVSNEEQENEEEILKKDEEEKVEKEKAEEARAAEELAKQNAGGNQV